VREIEQVQIQTTNNESYEKELFATRDKSGVRTPRIPLVG
jgi:hypothetical protein